MSTVTIGQFQFIYFIRKQYQSVYELWANRKISIKKKQIHFYICNVAQINQNIQRILFACVSCCILYMSSLRKRTTFQVHRHDFARVYISYFRKFSFEIDIYKYILYLVTIQLRELTINYDIIYLKLHAKPYTYFLFMFSFLVNTI